MGDSGKPLGAGSTPVRIAKVVVTADASGRLYALNTGTGLTHWTAPHRYAVPAHPGSGSMDFRSLAADGNLVFASSLDGSVAAYDIRTGLEQWRYIGPRTLTGPRVASLCVGSQVIVDLRSRHLRIWTYPMTGVRSLCLRMIAPLPIACAAACSGSSPSPTSPSPQLSLREGNQTIFFGASALSPNPNVKLCTPLGSPPAGTALSTHANLARIGDEWVARSTPNAGTLEMRFRAVGGNRLLGFVTGSANDRDAHRIPRDVQVNFHGTVTSEGRVSAFLPFGEGKAFGPITFTESNGSVGTCAEAEWTMQPIEGIFGANLFDRAGTTAPR